LRQLEVCRDGPLHFGRAAKKPYIGQPTLSKPIRRLQRESAKDNEAYSAILIDG